MTDGEILQKAIEKANKNLPDDEKYTVGLINFIEPAFYYQLIFSHDFAQSFWGKDESELTLWKMSSPLKEGEPAVYVGTYVLLWGKEKNPTVGFVQAELPAWELHLQIMVLEKEPIKYLAKFL